MADPGSRTSATGVAADLASYEAKTVYFFRDEVEAADEATAALLGDLRFEHLDHAEDKVRRFMAECWADRSTDHVPQGWNRRSDDAYELTLTEQGVKELLGHPALSVPMSGRSHIEEKAALAMDWMERACLTGDNLIAMLYRFFALEALPGDKSEGLKAHGLAFREMMLSHIVEGGFRHRAVRDALYNYLALAGQQGFTKRGKLLQFLSQHPDKPELLTWIRDYGGPDWNKFLESEMPAAPADGASPEAGNHGRPA